MNKFDAFSLSGDNVKKAKKGLIGVATPSEAASKRKKTATKPPSRKFTMDIHPYCQTCLAAHAKHWCLKDGTVYLKDKLHNEDLVICHLIHEEINIPASAREQLDPEELAIANFLQNPCSWTQAEFSWLPRDYQDLMLKCSALRKVSRIGRRAGKCFAYGEEIPLLGGKRARVETLINTNQSVIAYDQDTSEFINAKAHFNYNGIQDVYRVTLDDGTILQRTGNHPLLTAIGWRDTCDLTDGIRVAVPLSINRVGSKKIDKHLLKIIAYMIGDGNTTSGNFRFSSSSKAILDDLGESVAHYNCELKKYPSNKVYDYNIVTKKAKDHKLMREFERLSLMGKNSHNKRVPSEIMELDREYIGLFLNRLFATDGWAAEKSIGYCSVNRKLVDDIFELLLRFGIRARRRTRYVKLNGKQFISSELNITDKHSIEKFRNSINIFSKERNVEAVYTKFSRHKKTTCRFENYGKEVWDHFSSKEKTVLRNGYGLRPEYGPSTRILNKALDDLAISFTEFKNSNIGWASVVSVENIGRMPTVSVYVENYNTIVTDVIEHNTEAITIKMLHYAYTHEEVTVLVIAPYKNQVGLIFDKMESFLSRSDSLRASIKRNTKNPYRVEFHNRSKIMGFTSGTRTGSKSTGIRGQDAHLILMDEADYLGDSDFEVILAIQASRPDVLVWASSTPTGKREMFWRFCTETQLGFKEFHFPSSVSPSWTKQTERLERAQYTEHGYAHEFEAEFGDEAEGVFLGKYVDRSLDSYQLNECRPVKGNLYSMGVDWNTAGTGTVIIMVEWNKRFKEGHGAFKVVYKEVISQSEFTQIKACQKIITLNNIWNPATIYVDQGYGQTQIEMLHKYGLENPKTNLIHKVTGINFGSTIDIRDPVTKQRVKKHIKPFIVNLAARRMEDDQIILPSSEDIKLGLVGQIRDYTVIRESAFGQPIYSDDNDHAIIAWMLAIFGATMQYSDMTQQNRVSQVGIAGKFGEKDSKEFIQNKDIIRQEVKRQATAIVPRWGQETVFKETSLKGTMAHFSARQSAQKRANNNLTKRQQLARQAVRGRADF